MRCATRFVAALAAVAVVGYVSAASAAQYVIDSGLSSVTVTGQAVAFGFIVIPIVPQSAGSNVVGLQGDIDADDLGATLQFNSANIDGIAKPGPFNPGNAPADAAFYLNTAATGELALRNLVFSLSGTADPGAPNFDLSDLTLTIASGIADYNISVGGLGGGSLDLSGQSAALPAGVGSLVGNVMTIPISVTISQPVAEISGSVNVTITGQVVATLVPEPGTIAMLGMGIVGLVAVGRRRFRKA